ncbi:FdrA family protein [Sphaerisporangium sp. TRM90804]|uniref:FdrA family protein n=1 Tax=Sphaerisporangium sp. TRM90804 TaxID=3031113 RepID=UPI00244834E3|nr:FdrA family protein [Sphaerisporangium sp. TRM90804]MDH2424201.1 FdrA family protein [Sphaerisporangium sp. TRM90804]
MRVSQALGSRPGVTVAMVAMATELNVGMAREVGFEVPAAGPSDLLVAVRAESEEALGGAAEELERQFALLGRAATSGGAGAEAAPRTTRAAARAWDATLALVSVPGEHAFAEAMDAVEAGLSVMIFSDNVSLEHEILLKERAAEHGVLVMGPDCGTAVVGGAGLGFANVLRPGPVGVVAASGTGAQQVTCLLDHAGTGVSHVLGVGGRDLSAAVGARSTLVALRALDADPATELIVLISKPPAPEVAATVRRAVEDLSTPVVTALLGPGQDDLTAAAEKALGALGRPVPEWPSWPMPAGERPGGPLCGLYSGGTLCAEAEIIAGGGSFTDFGDDEYTRGRAHPMIDPSTRLAALGEVAGGVVLLDVVLGHAADPDPSARLAPAVRRARERGAAVVVALVGTDTDPQGLGRQAQALHEAGASVFVSNAAAARHAASLTGGTP